MMMMKKKKKKKARGNLHKMCTFLHITTTKFWDITLNGTNITDIHRAAMFTVPNMKT